MDRNKDRYSAFDAQKLGIVNYLEKCKKDYDDAQLTDEAEPRVYHVSMQNALFALDSKASERYVMSAMKDALFNSKFGEVYYVLLEASQIKILEDITGVIADDTDNVRLMITCVSDNKKRNVAYQFKAKRSPKFIKTGGKFDNMVKEHYCSAIAGHFFDASTTTLSEAIEITLQYLSNKMKQVQAAKQKRKGIKAKRRKRSLHRRNRGKWNL